MLRTSIRLVRPSMFRLCTATLFAVALASSSAAQAAMRVLFDARSYSSRVPTAANGLAVGDFDNDGVLDAVSSGDSSGFARGRGDGTFHSTPLAVGVTRDVVAGDFNEDGNLDAAFAFASEVDPDLGGIRVVLGTGTGSFSTPVDFLVPNGVAYMAVGDVSRDGHLDIVASKATADLIVVMHGNGLGAFGNPSTHNVASLPGRLIVQDVTDDGRLDVAVVHEGIEQVGVLRGRANGTLMPAIFVTTGGETGADIAAGDCNGDGRTDLVVAYEAHLETFPGESGGNYGAPLTTDTDAGRVVLADIDGDGHLDAFAGHQVSYGAGDGVFADAIDDLQLEMGAIAIGNVDAGSSPDLIALSPRGRIRTVLGNGGRSLGQHVALLIPTQDALSGDMNEDGLPDLVGVSNFVPPGATLLVFPNLGSRQFGTPVPQGTLADQFLETVLGDFDEDGHLDVLGVSNGRGLWWFRGRGDGTLEAPVAVGAVPQDVRKIATSDLDQDGHLDLVVAGAALVTVRGSGTGSFQLVSTLNGPYMLDFALGDFNEDGLPDIAYPAADDVARVRFNAGGATFGPAQAPFDQNAHRISTGDLDGDGHLDLVVALAQDYDNHYLHYGSGDGTFSPPTVLSGGYGDAIAVEDADQDGVPDIVASAGAYDFEVSLARGGGTYDNPIGYGSTSNFVFHMVDVDGDARLDILSPGPSILFARVTPEPAALVIAPNGGEALYAGQSVTLRWKARDDQAVTSVDLLISRAGRDGPYSVIASGIANTGSYLWTVQAPLTSTPTQRRLTAFLEVVAHDAQGQTGQDMSDAGFEIQDLATATLIARFEAVGTEHGVTVQWALAADAGVERLAIERAASEVGPWSVVHETADQALGGSFADLSAEVGATSFYRLVVTRAGGQVTTSAPIFAVAGGAALAFELASVSPNPIRTSARVSYAVAKAADVRVRVLDVQGRLVTELARGAHPPGRYEVTWTPPGRAAGLYFIRYEYPGGVAARRVAIAR